MMKYGYLPGCSLSGTGIEMNISTKAVANRIGLHLEEIPDWNCCGASSAHVVDKNLALALPARNLAIAEEKGLPLAIPCAACFLRCKITENAVRSDIKTRETVEYLIDRKYEGKYEAKNLIEVFLNEFGIDGLKAKMKRSLAGLKVASYYGCLLVRPPEITKFDDPEDPQSMDNIATAFGAESLNWNSKVQCCGGSYPTSDPKLGLEMTKDILDDAKKFGADCIICGCPLCVTNLDMRQSKLGKKYGIEYNIPILYFTELIGLAVGIQGEELGLKRHFIDPFPMLQEKGILKGGK